MGTMFIVATPIGNLEDVSIRAIKTLLSVDGIACEDTRKTGQLLKILRERYGMLLENDADHQPRLISYYEQNEFQRIPDIITALKNDLNIALVSDAGTPGVSDPGYRLIHECLTEGIPVVPVPGASSVLAGLVISGLPTDKFLFLGYPPHKSGKRMQLYNNLKKSQEFIGATVVFFEAPHKLLKTLDEIESVFGDIQMVFARELTKLHEEAKTMSISEARKSYAGRPPKGEFVLLFHPGE